jgi:tetratricopeptide (TPR) repeat protein
MIKSARDTITEYFASGRFEEGMKLFKEKESDLPEPMRLECLGNFHFYRREIKEAIKQYEAAITLSPDYLIARYQYLVGVQNEKQGDFVAAFKRYQNAIEIEPTFVDSYVELGALLVKVADFKGAAQCYRDAARLEPDDLGNLHNLKTVLAKLVAEEPEQYGAELVSAESAYEKLARSGKKLPQRHQW